MVFVGWTIPSLLELDGPPTPKISQIVPLLTASFSKRKTCKKICLQGRTYPALSSGDQHWPCHSCNFNWFGYVILKWYIGLKRGSTFCFTISGLIIWWKTIRPSCPYRSDVGRLNKTTKCGNLAQQKINYCSSDESSLHIISYSLHNNQMFMVYFLGESILVAVTIRNLKGFLATNN